MGPLSKHTTCNRVSARGLLGEGEGESERPCQSGDMREADRQTDRQRRKKRGKRVSCAWGALLRGAHASQLTMEKHVATGDDVTVWQQRQAAAMVRTHHTARKQKKKSSGVENSSVARRLA